MNHSLILKMSLKATLKFSKKMSFPTIPGPVPTVQYWLLGLQAEGPPRPGSPWVHGGQAQCCPLQDSLGTDPATLGSMLRALATPQGGLCLLLQMLLWDPDRGQCCLTASTGWRQIRVSVERGWRGALVTGCSQEEGPK